MTKADPAKSDNVVRISWVDYLPAAVAGQQASQLAQLYVGSPVTSGILVGLTALLGFAVALALSCLVRSKALSIADRPNLHPAVSVFVAIGLAIVIVAGFQALGSILGPKSVSTVAQKNVQLPQGLTVSNTAQDSEGLTEADISPELASMWAAAILKSSATTAMQGCLGAGGTEESCKSLRSVQTHSIITTGDQHKLVVINNEWQRGTQVLGRTVRVTALKNGQAISVGCVRFDDVPIVIFSGPCGDEIRRVIGYGI